jgi:hypothetical protein
LPSGAESKEVDPSVDAFVKETNVPATLTATDLPTIETEVEDDEAITYPSAVPLLLITSALVLAIFLTALVCLIHRSMYIF